MRHAGASADLAGFFDAQDADAFIAIQALDGLHSAQHSHDAAGAHAQHKDIDILFLYHTFFSLFRYIIEVLNGGFFRATGYQGLFQRVFTEIFTASLLSVARRLKSTRTD
jgi:hypothetical protein